MSEHEDRATPDASISACRAEIDRLDAGLRAALADRRRLSAHVQQRRHELAGPPIDPAREHELIARWTEELGPAAEPVVLAVLELCRGRADTPADATASR